MSERPSFRSQATILLAWSAFGPKRWSAFRPVGI